MSTGHNAEHASKNPYPTSPTGADVTLGTGYLPSNVSTEEEDSEQPGAREVKADFPDNHDIAITINSAKGSEKQPGELIAGSKEPANLNSKEEKIKFYQKSIDKHTKTIEEFEENNKKPCNMNVVRQFLFWTPLLTCIAATAAFVNEAIESPPQDKTAWVLAAAASALGIMFGAPSCLCLFGRETRAEIKYKYAKYDLPRYNQSLAELTPLPPEPTVPNSNIKQPSTDWKNRVATVENKGESKVHS